MLEMELPVLQPDHHRPTVYWYTTYRCNLACKHCSVHSSPYVDTAGDLSPEEALRAIDNIAQLRPGTVILTGGDPFTRPDALAIQQKLFDLRVRTGIETNAILIDREVARFLRRNADAGAQIALGISVDGGSAETHDFQRGPGAFAGMLRGVEAVVAEGLPVQFSSIVNRVNIDTIPDLFVLARQYKAWLLTFGFVNPIGRALEYLDDLQLTPELLERALETILDSMDRYPEVYTVIKIPPALIPPRFYPRVKRHLDQASGERFDLSTSCNFPLFGILPDGSITVCSVTRTKLKAYFGNVKSDSLVDVWRRQRFEAMRQAYLEADWLTGICGDCIFKKACKGSCRAWAYAEYGEFSGPHPLCRALEENGLFPQIYRLSHRDRLLASVRAGGGAT